jgi:hypothetical protein
MKKATVKSYEQICKEKNIAPATLESFNFLPEEHRVAAFGHAKLMVIMDELNEGKEHDWDNRDEMKHLPLFDLRTPDGGAPGSGFSLNAVYYVHTRTYLGARLHGKSEDTTRFSVKNYNEAWREFIKGK